MTILPLLRRELKIRARGPALYWTRTTIAAVGVLICLPSLLTGGASSLQGKVAFNSLTWLVFIFCSSMFLLTLDAISRERRNGTLGLLFLTNLSSQDVLLGKFGASGLTGLGALATFFPIAMLPVLAGGVTGGEAFRKALVLAHTLMISQAVGLWVSSAAREWIKAAGRALGIFLLILLGPMVVSKGILQSSITEGFALISPLALMIYADEGSYVASPDSFWISLFLGQIFVWAFLYHAGVRLRRLCMEDEPKQASDLAHVEPPQTVPFEAIEEPIDYLMRYRWRLKAIIWSGAIVGVAHHLLIFSGMPLLFFRIISVPVIFLQGPMFAWAASRFFIETRREGELELLLTTPAGAQKIVSGQWRVLKQFFFWPIILMLAPIFIHAWEFAMRAGQESLITPIHNCILSTIHIFLNTSCLCWMAMWFGFSKRNYTSALLWTVGLTRGLPFLLSTVVSLAIPAAMILGFSGQLVINIINYTSQYVLLAVYAYLIFFARSRLKRELPHAEGLGTNPWLGFKRFFLRLRSWPRPLTEAR